MMRCLIGFLAAGLLAATTVVAGCGSDLKCGPGTVAEDGYCRQTNPIDCDTNTAEVVDGVCQAKQGASTCGPGTEPNPMNPEECIPICGAGTAIDPVTHKCVPDASLIEPDVVEPAASEPNDPGVLEDGTPIDFTLPAAGSSTILAGVIGSPIDDGSGYLYADLDGWKFSTTGPTLLEIEGLPVSHVRFAFFVAPADQPWASERVGFDAAADHAKRQLWLDRAGDWVIVVTDANNLNDYFHPGFLGGADAPVGSDDTSFNYAFRVSTLGTPGDVNLPPATPMTGSYADGVRFYSLAPTTGQVVEFWNVPGSPDVYPATAFYPTSGSAARTSFDLLTLGRAGSDPLLFVADYDQAWSTDLSVQYLANTSTPVALGEVTAPVTRTGDAVATEGSSAYYTFQVTGGTLLRATADPGSSPLEAQVGIYDATMLPVAAPAPDFALAYVSPTSATEYVLRVTDATYAGGTTYTFDLGLTAQAVSLTAEAEPNDTIGAPQTVASLPAVVSGTFADSDDADVYKVTLPAGMTTLVIQTLPGPTTGADTMITLGTGGGTYIDDNDDIDYPSNPYSRLVETGLTSGSDYLIVVEAYDAGDYLLVVTAE